MDFTLIKCIVLLSLIAAVPCCAWLFSSAPKRCERECTQVTNGCFNKTAPYNNKFPLPECFLPEFRLFNRQTTATIYTRGIAITAASVPQGFATYKKTIIIVHGYRTDPTEADHWAIQMTRGFLQQGDFNVILTDWSNHSAVHWMNPFEQAASNTRVTAGAISDLVKALYSKGLTRTNTYCIGHSLGAHACGYAGQHLGYQKFGRITGLDPAGPKFRSFPDNARLSREDADFVDVIHTDAGTKTWELGILQPVGHIDFYPNGGQVQPGCGGLKKRGQQIPDIYGANKRGESSNAKDHPIKETVSVKETDDSSWHKLSLDSKHENDARGLPQNEEDLIEHLRLSERGKRLIFFPIHIPRIEIGCSHSRAVDYYLVTLTSECFRATQRCTGFEDLGNQEYRNTNCSPCGYSCPVMGYHADKYKTSRGIYYLATNWTAPYCP